MEEQNQNDALVLSCGVVAAFAVLLLVAIIVTIVVVAAVAADSTTSEPTPAALAPTPVPVLAREGVPDASGYTWTLIADGFDNPLFVTHAGDGSGRLFGVEQLGRIWVIEPDGASPSEPFLDVSSLISPDVFRGGYSERGLLGLAFHPQYEDNGFFYINYTDLNGDTVLARYEVSADSDRADPDSAVTMMMIDQPYDNHNGGHLEFGPDGHLYVASGDGGSQGDPHGYAQNPASHLGKILRLRVNADPNAPAHDAPPDNPFSTDDRFAPEVWAYGLRNPWRFSFDRATGDLFIADVGQWLWEEVNVQPASSSGGENYGWNYYESNLANVQDAPQGDFVWPVAEYAHEQGCSVTGGYVYRGATLPDMNGVYLYGDYCIGRIWAMYRDEAGGWHSQVWMNTGRQISSFGEDEAGELYLVDYKGEILRLEAAQALAAAN